MKKISKYSISTKLKAMIVLISSTILICVAILIVFNEYKILQKDLIYNSELNSKIIGEYCVNPLTFDDTTGCYDVLSKSESIKYIIDITVYDLTKSKYAQFSRRNSLDSNKTYKKPFLKDTIYTRGEVLNIIRTISFKNIQLGYIHLRASYKFIHKKINDYILTMSILLVITIIVTYVLGSNIQKIISKPILRLAKLTKEISQTGDYSRTIHVKSRDEIGILYTEFDNLLKVITQKNNEREQNKQVIIKLNEELEEKVKHRTRELLIEKEKTQELLNVSDNLLLNILPETIADRLKNGETTIADHYENASVVFIDIVDFTRKSANADPKRIVEVLNGLYSKLDSIAMKHGLEKIKTIGDCYMAAAGVPVINKNNACMAVKFAIEAMNTICDYDTGDGTIINFRCGIDGGPVVAGIIGERKFIYDLWGDTVNTASRMEEYGEAGKIHITERFANSLINSEEKLKITFEERGEIEIRGKGKMKTYFLNDYK